MVLFSLIYCYYFSIIFLVVMFFENGSLIIAPQQADLNLLSQAYFSHKTTCMGHLVRIELITQ